MKTVDVIALVWFGAFSVAAFVAFGWDKWRAGRSHQRVSEQTLVLFGALGGWLGGLLGMKMFRHKTVKWTFQLKYAVALIPFVAEVWAWWHFR